MKAIWKFPVQNKIAMPLGAKILSVQVQYGKPCIWAEVQTTNLIQPRIFKVFGTGHEIPYTENLEYIGTFQLDGGDFLGHLYEVF